MSGTHAKKYFKKLLLFVIPDREARKLMKHKALREYF